MANPQKENGYTAIANEIMDALCKIRIPGEERQILDCILRKTYGWHKCEDAISLSQFSLMTGIKNTHVIRAINGLLSKKVISITENGNCKAKVYKFIKDYHVWRPLPKKVTFPKKVIGVPKKGNFEFPKKGDTKETITKETITKDIYVGNTPTHKHFLIPTVEEISDYCQHRDNQVNAEKFFDFYSAKGWMIGKNKMKDWKAAVRTWEQKDSTPNKKEAWEI